MCFTKNRHARRTFCPSKGLITLEIAFPSKERDVSLATGGSSGIRLHGNHDHVRSTLPCFPCEKHRIRGNYRNIEVYEIFDTSNAAILMKYNSMVTHEIGLDVRHSFPDRIIQLPITMCNSISLS